MDKSSETCLKNRQFGSISVMLVTIELFFLKMSGYWSPYFIECATYYNEMCTWALKNKPITALS